MFVFVFLFFFVRFFLSTISRQSRGPIHAKFCMRAYSGSGCVFSPFGVSGPQGAENGGNEIFATIGVNGEFLHFDGF